MNTLLAESSSGMGGDICLKCTSKFRLLAFSRLALPSGATYALYYCRIQAADIPCNYEDRQGAVGLDRGGKRKYCCDTSNKKKTFSDCQWYDYGLGLDDGGFCRNNCPSNRIRIALDTGADGCESGGKARCCLPSYSDTIEVENPKLEEYRNALKLYLEDPVCATPGTIINKRGSLQAYTPPTSALSLFKRATSPGEAKTQTMLLEILVTVGTSAMLDMMEDIWDGIIGEKWPNLKVARLRPFVKDLREYGKDGPIQMAHDIVCSPNAWNNRVGGTNTVNCTEGFCTQENCEDYEPSQKRSTSPGPLSVSEYGLDGARSPTTAEWQVLVRKGYAVKRARLPYRPHLVSPSGVIVTNIRLQLPEYYSWSNLEPNHPIYDELLDYVSFDDCGNLRLASLSIPYTANGNGRVYESKRHFQGIFSGPYADEKIVEHLFDGNVMATFMEDAAAGRLNPNVIFSWPQQH
jgi:hypothetical protein